MNERSTRTPAHHQELREKLKALRGHRRQLHERLADVCEDFVVGDLTRPHRKKALVAELQYLLDFYKDDANWEGIA